MPRDRLLPVGIYAALPQRIVRRTRRHQVKARPRQLLLRRGRQQIALHHRHPLSQAIVGRVLATQRRQPRLQLDQRQRCCRIILSQRQPDDAHARSQVRHPAQRRRSHKVRQQQRIEAKPIPHLGLKQRQPPAQDRVAGQLAQLDLGQRRRARAPHLTARLSLPRCRRARPRCRRDQPRRRRRPRARPRHSFRLRPACHRPLFDRLTHQGVHARSLGISGFSTSPEAILG